MKNLIVLTFDDPFFKYFISFYNSIKQNYQNHPIIYAYYDGDNEDIINYLNHKENVVYKKYKNFEFGFEINLGVVGNPKIYFKYFLWTNEFKEYDKILYLDVDTLVLSTLDELFQKDEFFIVSDHSVNTSTTIFKPQYKDDVNLHKLLSEDSLKYPEGQDSMANAGVVLLSRKYRTKKHFDKLLYLTKRYNKYLQFADQSAISLWCIHNKINYSYDFRYNLQILHFYTNLIEKPEILYNAKILHYSYYKADYLGNLIQALDLTKFSYHKYLQYKKEEIKYDLYDLSVIISLKIDSKDRLRNLKVLLNFINHSFINKEIIIIEQDTQSRIPKYLLKDKEIQHYFLKSSDCHYKTRNLNYGISFSIRKYIMMCDADILVVPESIYHGLEKLRNGSQFVAPYNGIVVNIDDNYINKFLTKENLAEGLNNLVYYEKNYNLNRGMKFNGDQYPLYGNSYYDNTGGCILFDKKAFHLVGGYNTNIISYGFEDMEFNLRITKMGHTIEKINGYNIYHLNHKRKFDSYYNNYYKSNNEEYLKVLNMNREELKSYIQNGFKKIKFNKKSELTITNTTKRYSLELLNNDKYDLKGISVLTIFNSGKLKNKEEFLLYYNNLENLVDFFDHSFINYEIIMNEINGEYFKYLQNKKNYIHYNMFINTEPDIKILNRILEKTNYRHIILIGLKNKISREKIIQMIDQPDNKFKKLSGSFDSSLPEIQKFINPSEIYFIKK